MIIESPWVEGSGKIHLGACVNDDALPLAWFGETYVSSGENGVGKLMSAKTTHGSAWFDVGWTWSGGVVYVLVDLCVVCVVGAGTAP